MWMLTPWWMGCLTQEAWTGRGACRWTSSWAAESSLACASAEHTLPSMACPPQPVHERSAQPRPSLLCSGPVRVRERHGHGPRERLRATRPARAFFQRYETVPPSAFTCDTVHLSPMLDVHGRAGCARGGHHTSHLTSPHLSARQAVVHQRASPEGHTALHKHEDRASFRLASERLPSHARYSDWVTLWHTRCLCSAALYETDGVHRPTPRRSAS